MRISFSLIFLTAALLLWLTACQTADPAAPAPIKTAAANALPTTGSTPLPAPSREVATLPPPPTLTAIPVKTDNPGAPVEEATPEPPPTPTVHPAFPAGTVNLAAVISGFFKPLGIEHAGDERLFVIEQTGTIRVVTAGQLLDTPFLDIRSRVTSIENEQGLLGLAFHPDYKTNGKFYVNYSRASDGSTVIAEYRVPADTPNRADRDTARILLTISQPFANHNGGQIRFGPDGYLYIGMGDGGSQGDPANNGQNPGALLGALLRIDVDHGDPYAIPADNPFVDQPGARPEVWAIGLRNPWRFSFDRETGDLFIADVGQNEWEEIDFQPAASPGGENYGWRILEGTHCYAGDCATPGLTAPIAEYSHLPGHCSVTGGFVYRGEAYPALYGNYFFADYCSGTIWRLFPNGDGSWDMAQLGRAPFLVSSFGEDVNGELYIVSQTEGAIYRVTP